MRPTEYRADRSELSARRTRLLQRRIRWIVAATISYNVVEAIVAVAAGTVSSSVALVGFGLDSIIEVLSAAAVAWQFAAADPEKREKTALRVISLSFFALAVYVVIDSGLSLFGLREAEKSLVGTVLTAASMLIMPFLSLTERRTGRELGSASAVADSKQTLVCCYLSAAVLVGLVVNATLGWAWADPIAALVIAGFAVKEGAEAWRGDTCSVPLSSLTNSDSPSAFGR